MSCISSALSRKAAPLRFSFSSCFSPVKRETRGSSVYIACCVDQTERRELSQLCWGFTNLGSKAPLVPRFLLTFRFFASLRWLDASEFRDCLCSAFRDSEGVRAVDVPMMHSVLAVACPPPATLFFPEDRFSLHLAFFQKLFPCDGAKSFCCLVNERPF